MKTVVLVVSLMIACTGPTHVSEPQRTIPTQKDDDGARQGQSCEAAAPTPLKPTIIPSGFWCTESREAADRSPLNVCYSTEGTCKRLRKEGVASGYVMSACRSRGAAYCFTATDAAGQRVHWRCYENLDECLPLREKAIGQQPTFRFSECGLTNPSQTQSTQRTAARL